MSEEEKLSDAARTESERKQFFRKELAVMQAKTR